MQECIHYGVGHDKGGKSGRYPWGSGKEPYASADTPAKIKKLSLSEQRELAMRKLKSMSDEDLYKLVDKEKKRARYEADYLALHPLPESKVKKKLDKLMKEVVKPAATDASKQMLKEFLVNQAKSAGKAASEAVTKSKNKKKK